MKLAYQVSTPEVRYAPGVTAYQAPLRTSFAKAKACGYDGVELMVADPCKIDVEELKSLCKEFSLEIPMVCTGEVFGQDGFCFSDPNPERRAEAIKRAKDAVDVAAEFNAQINIGRLKGGRMYGYPDDECIARSVAALKEVAQYAGSKGVIMAIEPVNPIAANYINTTQEGLALIQEIDEPFCKIMLDTNHMYIADLDEIKSVYDAKGSFTYVHLVDSNRLYPGNCKLDFEAFLKAFADVGYDGWLSVEVFQRPDQDTCIEKSAEYIQGLMEKLNLR